MTKKSNSTNRSIERSMERVVMPSQIANLPTLTGYIAFTGNYPISKFSIGVFDLLEQTAKFEERGL